MKLFFAKNLEKSDGKIFIPLEGENREAVSNFLPDFILDDWNADFEVVQRKNKSFYYKLPILNASSESFRANLKNHLGFAIKALKKRRVSHLGIYLPAIKNIGLNSIEDILTLPVFMEFDEHFFCKKNKPIQSFLSVTICCETEADTAIVKKC